MDKRLRRNRLRQRECRTSPLLQVMQLEAGMELEEQSKTKRGPPLEFAEGKMTRSGYKLLCDEERSLLCVNSTPRLGH